MITLPKELAALDDRIKAVIVNAPTKDQRGALVAYLTLIGNYHDSAKRMAAWDALIRKCRSIMRDEVVKLRDAYEVVAAETAMSPAKRRLLAVKKKLSTIQASD